MDPEAFEQALVLLAEYHGEVCAAALKLGKLFLCFLRSGIGQSGDGQGNEHFIRVKSGVFVGEIASFQLADGFQHLGRDQVDAVVNAGKVL